MPPLVGLGAVLAWNYHRHRHGQTTICGTTRRHIPRTLVALALPIGAYMFWRHLINGYPPNPPHKENTP